MLNIITDVLDEGYFNYISNFEDDLIDIYKEISLLNLPDNCYNIEYIQNKQCIYNELVKGLDANFLELLDNYIKDKLSQCDILILASFMAEYDLPAEIRDQIEKVTVWQAIEGAKNFYNDINNNIDRQVAYKSVADYFAIVGGDIK